MTEERNRLDALMRKLETERDELRVKMELAKLEARDDWEELESKMDQLRGRMKVVGEEAKEASDDVATAIGMLADEVREGFSRLRRLL